MKKITNKQEALEAVMQDGMRLEECSDDIRNDKIDIFSLYNTNFAVLNKITN